jgi:hypothetical protein
MDNSEETRPLKEFLVESLWENYIAVTPQTREIYRLLEERGEDIEHDHFAIRTFDLDAVSIEKISLAFLSAGYEPTGTYEFEDKKVRARSFRDPNKKLPRVFLSEFITAHLSPELQTVVNAFVDEVDEEASAETLLGAERNWSPVSHATYLALAKESEYAAWVAAFGIRANHFTVSVNSLDTFASVADLNSFLKERGFALNTSGGEIKGSREDMLIQSSTVSLPIQWNFQGWETQTIPGGYCEFARRFPNRETGEIFEGFVPESANRIFESTNRVEDPSSKS